MAKESRIAIIRLAVNDTPLKCGVRARQRVALHEQTQPGRRCILFGYSGHRSFFSRLSAATGDSALRHRFFWGSAPGDIDDVLYVERKEPINGNCV